MSKICTVNLNAQFRNDQNFYMFLHTLDFYEDLKSFVFHKDVVSSERMIIEKVEVIVIKYYRFERNEWYDLFYIDSESHVSSKNMCEMFMHRIREVFVEEFV